MSALRENDIVPAEKRAVVQKQLSATKHAEYQVMLLNYLVSA